MELSAGHLPPTPPWIPAFAGMNWGAGTTSGWAVAFRHTRGRVTSFSYQSLMPAAPAPQGMKRRNCGLVQRIGTADSATPHPDPCGGQAPALHFLIPPSIIGLQVGTFRRWRAGIEVDWWAHPGSESGTCFRSNDEMGWGATNSAVGLPASASDLG